MLITKKLSETKVSGSRFKLRDYKIIKLNREMGFPPKLKSKGWEEK